MAQIRDTLRCGECGGDRFAVFNVRNEGENRAGGGGDVGGVGSGVAGYLAVKCAQCGNETEVRAAASLVFAGAEGHLCGGWKEIE